MDSPSQLNQGWWKLIWLLETKTRLRKRTWGQTEQSALKRTISHTTRTSLRNRDCYERFWLIDWWRRWLMDERKKRKQRKEKDENGGSVIRRHQAEEWKGKDKGVNRQRAAQMILRWCGWWFLQDTRPGWFTPVDWPRNLMQIGV